MSATARAPRPDDDAPRSAARARGARTGPRTAAARPAPARATAPARPAPRSAPAPAPEGPVPPVRGRAHSAPVRAGSLRTRPSRPVPRPAPAPAAAPAGEPRRRTAAAAARRTPFVLLVVGLLVGTTLALLFLNTAIAVNSLKATEVSRENTQRAQRLERLEQQVVAAGTPGVMAAAASAAGLVQAGTAGYLVIGPDGSATLRGTPEPAPAAEVAAPPAAED